MKKWKSWQISLFAVLCVLLNLGGRMLAVREQWPLWLDSFGTALCAWMGGPVCGAIVGLTGNAICARMNNLSMVYALTSIALGLITGYAARRRWFDTFYGAMKAASLAIAVAAVVSIPLNMIFAGGYTGNVWGNAIIDYLLDKGWPFPLCCVLGQGALDFADKLLTMLVLYLIIRITRVWSYRKAEEKLLRGTGEKAALVLAAVLLAGLSLAAPAARAAATGSDDYNDYVQTVYSSTNGLPCGEANDIVQTNDGVLWIGTYAGLYRFNGREFQWIDDFESVKNVNCLFVDEEGRLWIGTNDNGLSIVIHENVVNVVDDTVGLSSNSVRCITQSADGYYYVGTTGSMQMLMMNNGLKIANALREINYADSITADAVGSVATISSDGRLFLLRGGRILCSMRLTNGQEQFNSCAFAPDGTLMVGSSTNHIYRYDISRDDFDLIDVMTCDDITNINNMNYLPDGTLFISTDSGVSYVDTQGVYHRINTNDFNNSIDNMEVDYQGNLWFTSSRLGLLRLAKSAFRDIYGTIGMPRRVVNAVVRWQGDYYIGTDKGLDVVDGDLREQRTNDLTRQLEGIRIRCMLVDDINHLWVCTYGSGLMEFSPEGERWLYDADNGGFGSRARTITRLSDGTLLAAGDTGISFIRDHEIIQTIRNEHGLINSMILTATELDDGTILAGTDGDGIAVIREGRVTGMLTREDGLPSGVILRTARDPASQGVFVVTSNSLCYLEPEGGIRVLDNFPYFNNYDVWPRPDGTLFVMSSAGIYVVDRDALVEGGNLSWELLDARRGLSSSLTANSWNTCDEDGNLFLPCDTGVYVIDTNHYDDDASSYRMQLTAVRLDGVEQPFSRDRTIAIGQGVNRVELCPEILNYTIQEPNVGYMLEGVDTEWTVVPQGSLGTVIYRNLPAGAYTFHLAIFDNNAENILDRQQFSLVKTGEMYERPAFRAYLLVILISFILWFAWLVVQRQLNNQQIKLNMANETVMAIAAAVDAKDVRTSQHSARVAEYSVLIAEEMKCFKWWQRRRKLANLRKAAQMHDIGKIGIPDQVLNKAGRLTDEEYAMMKSHVTRGAEILKDFTLVENVVEGARFHHERFDGRGYPDHLQGDQIPLYGRIIAVADAFDAMTSNRVYRNQMDTDYVITELKRCRGSQFDPEPLDAFMRLIDKGVINMQELYARRSAEVAQVDQKTQDALARRVEEDKRQQADAMKTDKPAAPDKPETSDKPAASDKPASPDKPAASDKPASPDKPETKSEAGPPCGGGAGKEGQP